MEPAVDHDLQIRDVCGCRDQRTCLRFCLRISLDVLPVFSIPDNYSVVLHVPACMYVYVCRTRESCSVGSRGCCYASRTPKTHVHVCISPPLSLCLSVCLSVPLSLSVCMSLNCSAAGVEIQSQAAYELVCSSSCSSIIVVVVVVVVVLLG